jgi:hypothetical protein
MASVGDIIVVKRGKHKGKMGVITDITDGYTYGRVYYRRGFTFKFLDKSGDEKDYGFYLFRSQFKVIKEKEAVINAL